MFIFLGKTLYLFIWCFLLFNLVSPYPQPAGFIAYIALGSFILIHGLQAWLLHMSLTNQEKEKDKFKTLRFFLFGFFEALSWKKKTAKSRNKL